MNTARDPQNPAFEELTPDRFLDVLESALGTPLTGFANPLNSYINRVYEIAAKDGVRYIAKFYRPGRWSRQAIAEEHLFIADCAAAEIPVVPPLPLNLPAESATAAAAAHLETPTLGEMTGIPFAIFPKRRGREMEPRGDDDWRRLGRLVGRIHLAGGERVANARICLGPATSTVPGIRRLLEGGFVTPKYRAAFENVTKEILAAITPLFRDAESLRIHGDCHRGNLLERPEEGLVVIDFDDMVMGPPVQDLWMLLPDHAPNCRHEIACILEGYEDFRPFDPCSLRLIEPLRVMRMLYYLAWCSLQADDLNFRNRFREWGTEAFWGREVAELSKQLNQIRESPAPQM